MTIIPLTYLPSVELCAHIARGECTIDLGEHFVKRSERNRTRILAGDGAMELTINVQRANRPCTPMRDVRIDYSKRWQHQHWSALVSSYKGSAYFDHYADRFEPFYRKQFTHLVDYNLALLEMLLGAMRVAMPSISESYIDAQPCDIDLRAKHKEGSNFTPEPYFQVFSDRLPFEANLSSVDLLFAEGPASAALLGHCLR